MSWQNDEALQELQEQVLVLDAVMHSVWLYGKWEYLTRQMTTEEREAAWAAVKRHSVALDPSAEPLTDEDWAWWR